MTSVQHQQVTGLNVSFDIYIKNGWKLVPIPPQTKGPNSAGWNRIERCITDSTQIPPGFGVGLAHAYSGTCAIDIDVWDVAHAELLKHGIDLNQLYDAPDAVTVESGNVGHGKLLYRMPFGLALTSKKLIYTTPEGTRKNYLDFRCATSNGLTQQDVLPPHRHPITQQLYTFGGKGKWENLPTIPDALLTLWSNLLEEDKQRTIKVEGSKIDASWDDIRSALSAIDPSCDRDTWLYCMMSLHHAGTQTDQLDTAFTLFDEWSSQSPTKYKGPNDIMNSWRGLRPDKGITLGTLFHKAQEAGWQRPMPNVAEMFSPIGVTADPKSVLESFRFPRPYADMDLIPEVLAKRALEVGAGMGCDPLAAVWAGLGAACAVANAQARLKLKEEFLVPPVLWLCTIGEPADKKTPAARPMLKVLADIEAEDVVPFRARKLMFEAADARYAQLKKHFLETSTDSTQMLDSNGQISVNEATSIVLNQPEPPVPLRLVVNDITSQKLVRMCAERPRGVLCHMDEMRGWATKVSNPTSGENRSTWVKSYEADSESMDRVGDGKNNSDGNIIAKNFAVSMFGNLQPRAFRNIVGNMTDDGLFQRFIPAILTPELSDKRGDPVPVMFSHAAQYEAAIRRIYSVSNVQFQLSNEAANLYRDFEDWWHDLKRDERILSSDENYQQSLGKLTGNCGRIIFIWHLFEAPHNPIVSSDTARKAIQFVKTYVAPALFYLYAEVGGGADNSIDKIIADFIIQRSGEVDHLTMRDLRRSVQRRVENMTPFSRDMLIRDVMNELELKDWVKQVDTRKDSTRWIVSPYLASQFKSARAEIVAAKQRNLDRARGIAEHKLGKELTRRYAVGFDSVAD